MRVLFWYCDAFAYTPARKTLEDAPPASPAGCSRAVVAFVHVEPADVEADSGAETKLVKNAKWMARKWDTPRVVLHSFTHLGEDKAVPAAAQRLLAQAAARLEKAGYAASQTPYGYFIDLEMRAPGHPLARVFKAF
jgi:hypothetical protein